MPHRPNHDDYIPDHLVDIAEDLYGEYGSSLPMQLVWERAEIDATRFHRLFPSKESLIAIVVDARYEALLEWSMDHSAAEISKDSVLEWFGELVLMLLKSPDLSSMLLDAFHRQNAVLHPMSRHLSLLTGLYILDAKKKDSHAKIGDVEIIFIALLAATSASEKLYPGNWDLMLGNRMEAVCKMLSMVEFFLYGSVTMAED